MNYISSNEALEKIRSMGISYVMEADALDFHIREGEKVECFVNDGVLVVINWDDDTEYVSVLPISESFDIDEYLALIREKCENPSMLVNIHKLSSEFSGKLDEVLRGEFAYSNTLTDYMYAKNVAPEKGADVRLLTVSDKDAFVACSDEQIKNRPPLAFLFDMFINKNQGLTLSAFDGERVIGYLAFYPVADGVYDVDYIYVAPDKRGAGVGKKLAAAYAAYAMENGCYAYWSNAKNEASVRTAMGCGFEKIRVADKYIKAE